MPQLTNSFFSFPHPLTLIPRAPVPRVCFLFNLFPFFPTVPSRFPSFRLTSSRLGPLRPRLWPGFIHLIWPGLSRLAAFVPRQTDEEAREKRLTLHSTKVNPLNRPPALRTARYYCRYRTALHRAWSVLAAIQPGHLLLLLLLQRPLLPSLGKSLSRTTLDLPYLGVVRFSPFSIILLHQPRILAPSSNSSSFFCSSFGE